MHLACSSDLIFVEFEFSKALLSTDDVIKQDKTTTKNRSSRALGLQLKVLLNTPTGASRGSFARKKARA